MIRRLLPVVIAFGLASAARADDPWALCTPYWDSRCGGAAEAEPKDVVCMLSHDCVQVPDLAGYRWYLTSPRTLCGETRTSHWIRRRDGVPMSEYARPKIDPYTFSGDCFPRFGESRTYVARAVDDAGLESVNDSNSYTVIGTSICCADATGWVPCWPGAAPCRFP